MRNHDVVILFVKVLAITNYNRRISLQHGKKVAGTLANLLHHLPDITNADATTLARAISFEFGIDAANKFGAKLYHAFLHSQLNPYDSSRLECVDARFIIITYKATILAEPAFHNPIGVFLKLINDLATQYNDCNSNCISKHSDFVNNKQWALSDILRTICIASSTNEEVKDTAGILQQSFQYLLLENKSKYVTMDDIIKCLDSSPAVMQNFRSQMLSKLSSNQRLRLLAREEVSLSSHNSFFPPKILLVTQPKLHAASSWILY